MPECSTFHCHRHCHRHGRSDCVDNNKLLSESIIMFFAIYDQE